MNLLERRKEIPTDREYNSIRRDIRRQLKVSLRKDREAWFIRRTQEMEGVLPAGNKTAVSHHS